MTLSWTSDHFTSNERRQSSSTSDYFLCLFQIRLGKGVVGKVGYVAAFCVVGAVAVALPIAMSGFQYLAAALTATGIAAAVYCVHSMIGFADRNPRAALMEGAELVRSLEIEQAAKEVKIIEGNEQPVANEVAQQPVQWDDV